MTPRELIGFDYWLEPEWDKERRMIIVHGFEDYELTPQEFQEMLDGNPMGAELDCTATICGVKKTIRDWMEIGCGFKKIIEDSKILDEVEEYLQDHKSGTSMSGHFDMVPPKLANDFSRWLKARKGVSNESS